MKNRRKKKTERLGHSKKEEECFEGKSHMKKWKKSCQPLKNRLTCDGKLHINKGFDLFWL